MPAPPNPRRRSTSATASTDTLVGWLGPLALAAGIPLDFHRYTIPGAGTPWLWDHPTDGFGEADIQQSLETEHYDQLSVQPAPNGPCTPAGDGSDSDYADRFYQLAKHGNAEVELWIYAPWPSPVDLTDCFSAGSPWATPPWTPPTPDPATWSDAVDNQLAYQEAVRDAVQARNPGGKTVYIVPAGLALRNLEQEVLLGHVDGISDFFGAFFGQNGTDSHLTDDGRYFISLVFEACMFQRTPQGLPWTGTTLSAAQAATLQSITWSTVTAYRWSGAGR